MIIRWIILHWVICSNVVQHWCKILIDLSLGNFTLGNVTQGDLILCHSPLGIFILYNLTLGNLSQYYLLLIDFILGHFTLVYLTLGNLFQCILTLGYNTMGTQRSYTVKFDPWLYFTI